MAVYVTDSILASTKSALGIVPEYEGFDNQLIMLINASFATLFQIGIGPEDGFSISNDEAVWTDYIGNNKLLNNVITYVHIDVKLHFDPPQNSFSIQMMEKQLEELTWRINILAEQDLAEE